MPVQTLIQIRRGTATTWTSANTVLSAGEWGYETDTGRYKIGDGLTGWNSLDYAAVTPDSFSGTSGILVTQGTNGSTIGISVSGITSSQINDFNSSVSGLLPSVTGGSGISVNFASNLYTVSLSDPTIQVGDITDFAEGVDDRVNSLLQAGTNISLSYNDEANTLTINSTLGTEEVQDAIGTYVSGVSGISVSYNDNTGYTTISLTDPTVQLSDITDLSADAKTFLDTPSSSNLRTLVSDETGSGSLVFASGATLTNTVLSGSVTIGSDSLSETIDDRVSSLLTTGSGIGLNYNDGTNTLQVSVTGIPSSLITDFATAVSDQVDTTLAAGTGIGLVYTSGNNTLTVSVTGISHTLVQGLGTMSTQNANSVAITNGSINVSGLTVNSTGVSLAGHTHSLVDITDVTASSTEVNYLDGSIPGTGVAGKAVVLDSNLSVTNIGSITTTGNVTVGGNLVVQGTTTTVNSTTVDIGDNIIRVNTSGLNTGGFEVYTGVDYKQLVWNTSNNRWEFSGGDVYTSGNFIGNLNGNADTVTSGVYTYQTGTVTSTMILDGTIVDADINSSANINVQKLASGSTGQVLQVSSTGIIWGGIDGGTP